MLRRAREIAKVNKDNQKHKINIISQNCARNKTVKYMFTFIELEH